MKRFAALHEALDTTNSTNAKVDALVHYFHSAPPADAVWALYFLSGRKLRRLLPTSVLREALGEASSLPAWLIEESYANVGDLAETIALLLPSGAGQVEEVSLAEWVRDRLLPMRGTAAAEQRAALLAWWRTLSTREIFVLNKLVTGGFRSGVSHALVVRAVAKWSGQAQAVIAHRLMGDWHPTPEFFAGLSATGDVARDPGLPYPFFLASPIEKDAERDLGEPSDFLIEWKWDGIRTQALRRSGGVYLWSRGEELITERFPEVTAAVARLPLGTVLDGEILAYRDDVVQPFALLQQRIGRKKLTPKILADIPVAFMVFDCLEFGGEDLRDRPLAERRARLERLLAPGFPPLRASPLVAPASWEALAGRRDEARERKVEGLMLKRRDSPYRVGRRRGDWWKWKVDPFTMDAVLLYAQPGHGRRSTLYTDYTFGVWKEGELVPIAKAYSGLTDAEILELDRWIRRHTVEKFGPVRRVEPHHVFELAFEALAPSPRHKSGLAVRFPRILRRRDDKRVDDADTVERVRELLRVA